jgi:GNAT superfamily N-acetyltransferase
VEIRANVLENRLSDPSRVTREDIRWFIANPGLWVWYEDGAVRGFSAADPRNGFIWALFVDAPYGGRGIGRALLAQACQTPRETGFTRIWLTTDPGTRAERLYRKDGWQLIGEKDNELLFERAI